ncbi:GNAT family N-acetyltransferase [Roseivirga misakiensis]|uniref:N-acetyltransferase domain-containing protein n=1 Tax=Roseivirga misakiensis TaxID=1563681 RepID=A0A1E5SZ74_9BACT|nr:GNAT family N-acetyltransferase [Roseivirga misakiensis]OEK04347.1 hypothetical protein BFP71_12760 [Roseivirga misakiensis]
MNDSLIISKLEENEFERLSELVILFNEVFDEYNKVASDRQLKKLLKKADFLAIVAVKQGKIIGGLTAYELAKYYTDKSELYIYDIAVKTKFQNQGIGKQLIEYLKDYSVKNGIEGIFVEAHSDDESAVKFYESTFGESEKVDHFNFEIKITGNNENKI